MHVVDVAPKDIHVLIDFSLKELVHLSHILDNMTFDFNSEIEEQQGAADFLNGSFYSTVNDILKELTDGA